MPPSQWVTGEGKHIPVWDPATHRAILDELARRDGRRTRAQTYHLTGVLTCAHCGKRLYRHGRVGSRYPVELTCPGVPAHVIIRYDIAHKIVAAEVTKQLKRRAALPPLDRTPEWDAQRAALHAQRDRIQQGYLSKIFTQDEAAQQIVSIETEMEKVEAQRLRAQQQHDHTQVLLQLAQQDLDRIHHWLLHDDPTTVNRLLTALCETITITPRYELTITWR